jgi:HK97 family phage portal protein
MNMDEITKKIQALKSQNLSIRDIAELAGVSKSTVARKLKEIPEVQKSFLNPQWVSLSSGDRSGKVDIFGAVGEPDLQDLVNLYEDSVYICSRWLSDFVSSVPLKVYVETQPHQPKPKCLTQPIITKSGTELTNKREVLEHEFKDLLDKPNPEMNRNELLRIIDLDLSLTGNGYIHKVRDDDNLPCYLYPLLPQFIDLDVDDNGHLLGFKDKRYNVRKFYPKKDVIWFKFVDPRNHYGLGVSPVRGCYERVLQTKNELAYISALYRNQARPDSLITVDGITASESERMQKEMNMRFKQGGIGGCFVTDGKEVDMKPLNWSPKETLSIELIRYTKLQIVNAFGLNLALFDSDNSNRATADTARYLATLNGVLPRLRLIEEKLNQHLAPEFDDRLVCGFADPVSEDRAERLKEITEKVKYHILTLNEARKEEGLPPIKGGDVFYTNVRETETDKLPPGSVNNQ